MAAAFCVQHWLTALRHHSALRRDARIGLSPTITKIGLVCDEGRIRAAIQLLRSMATSNARSRGCPSATTLFDPATLPLTTISTVTSRLLPARARSMSQYGL